MALTSDEILLELRVIIANESTTRLSLLDVDADMRLDAAGDPSEVMPVIVMVAEERFHVSIPDKEVSSFRTVGDLRDFIVEQAI